MNNWQNLQLQNSNHDLQGIRKLWNEWDPIGILPFENDILDEYDFYLETTLSLLKRKATPTEIENYLIFVIKELMGLDSTHVELCKPNEFARRIQVWFVNRELEGDFDC